MSFSKSIFSFRPLGIGFKITIRIWLTLQHLSQNTGICCVNSAKPEASTAAASDI